MFKCFVRYERPWWGKAGFGDVVVTGLPPFQKLYLDHRGLLFWYRDSQSALRMHESVRAGVDLTAMASNALNTGLDLEVTPVGTAVSWFWPEGITYSAVGCPPAPTTPCGSARARCSCPTRSPNSIGWLDGSFASALAAARALSESDETARVLAG